MQFFLQNYHPYWLLIDRKHILAEFDMFNVSVMVAV